MLPSVGHLHRSGRREAVDGPDQAESEESRLLSLGAEAPPSRFAPALVFTVTAGFFVMQVVDILDEGVTPLTVALCLTVLPMTVSLHVAQTLPGLNRFRSQYGRWMLLLQYILMVVPCLLLDWAWGHMGGFVGASTLLVLPMRIAVPLFALLVFVMAACTGIHAGFTSAAVPYMTVSTLLTGIIVYSIIRLADLTIAVHEAKDDVARMAVTKERLRFARDLHDLLGYSLSAVTLKGELAHQLVERSPERTRDELRGIIDTSRQALADIREVSRSYRSLSLLNELPSVRSVLSAAGIEAHLKVDYDRLSSEADTALATVVREGISNVVRHSKASHCRIETTQEDGLVSLRIVNNGVPPPEHRAAKAQGGGLENLTARLTAIGGHLEAGVGPDGCFHLIARTPAPRNLAHSD